MLGNLNQPGVLRAMLSVMLSTCGHSLKKGFRKHGATSREYPLENGLRVIVGTLRKDQRLCLAVIIATRSQVRVKSKIKEGQRLFSIIIRPDDLTVQTIAHQRNKTGVGSVPIDFNYLRGLQVYLPMLMALSACMKENIPTVDFSLYGNGHARA